MRKRKKSSKVDWPTLIAKSMMELIVGLILLILEHWFH